MSLWSDYRLFFREYVRHFHDTGSISPSSRWLAAALARYVGGAGRPQRILEVGPGTGAVTRTILRRMTPEDCLDLVEMNESFVQRLRQRLTEESPFVERASQVRVFHQRLESLPQDEPYDVIISGLPLNNFTVADVKGVLASLRGLLAPAGTLSFFEYIAIRPVRAVVSRSAERKRLRGIGQTLGALLKPHEFRRDWVWPNVPPAWVHHVRLKGVA